jgi:hypothetical protein
MSRSHKALVLFALAAAACNQTPIETPVRSFDRPSDVALTCVLFNPEAAGFDPLLGWLGRYEPRPLSACAPLPSGQQDTFVDPNNPSAFYSPELRALVANSARGEVALVNVPLAVLIDLDRKNPGFNFVPVGRLPETIRASGDGCMAVTANVDSCDLAVLDLTTLYNMPFAVNQPGESRDFADRVVRRVELWTPAVRGEKPRRLESRPTALELTPLVEHRGSDLSCGGATYHAWIALPGCEAVVEAELSLSGDFDPVRAHITRALKVDRNGATFVDPTQLTCPAECSAGAAPQNPGDPLMAVNGRLPATQAAPGTLAIDGEDQTQRLVIGDLYGERLTILPLDSGTGAPAPPHAVQLEPGALGVMRARISPRTPAGKFLYAVARDGTVRVVDMDREVECETNPDPIEFAGLPPPDPLLDARRLGCLPLGDRATPHRSAAALGPGIRLPNGALARDVAFVHLDTPDPPVAGVPPFSAQPGLLVGDFAWIASSDGRATAVQVYDACPQPNDPQLEADGVTYTPACDVTENVPPSRLNAYLNNFGAPYPLEVERLSHHIRNGERRFLQPNNVGDAAGTPRLSDPSNPVTVTVKGSPAKVGAGFRTPTLETVLRSVPGLTPASIVGYPTQLEIPDPQQIRGETWTLGWEGVIPGTNRSYGTLCGPGADDCPRASLIDAGAAVCSRGVQAGDKVELLGCASDDDCVYTQVCAHDPAAPADVTSGLCLDRNDQGDPLGDQLTTCSPLLRAQRRYRIVSARQDEALSSGRVVDVLSLAEIYEPEFPAQTHACVIDADCTDIAVPAPDSDVAQRAPLPTRCLLDTDAQPRCLRACDPTKTDERALCGAGYLCAQTSTSTPDNPDFRCVRAPLDVGLFQACFEKAQKYQVRVGDSFSVAGSSSGFLTNNEPDAITHECGPPPESSEFNRLRNPRIPLDAPLCPQQIDADLGIDAISWVGEGGPNVCQFVTTDKDKLIHFENPVMAFALRVPHNPDGYIPEQDTVVSFAVVGGGIPLGLTLGISGQLNAQSPKSMVTAPDLQTVFVIDEGKGTASTALRGQLLRLVSSIQTCDPAFQVR